MVTQAGAAAQSFSSDPSRQGPDDMDLIIEWFLNEVTWFAIYSCILGVVMLIGTYVSIMLFNFAAHSQVKRDKSVAFSFSFTCFMSFRFSE